MDAPSGMYLVSGSRPRLPTRMTLFTDAISTLPAKQFAHAALVPLFRHDLEARDALAREHLGFAHAAHRETSDGSKASSTLKATKNASIAKACARTLAASGSRHSTRTRRAMAAASTGFGRLRRSA